MPKSRVRKKNGKKVKYQTPKKKQFSAKEIQKLTELFKNIQAAQQEEAQAIEINEQAISDSVEEIKVDENIESTEINNQ